MKGEKFALERRKQQADITWDNEDGTIGTFLSDFLISELETTQAVEAPV